MQVPHTRNAHRPTPPPTPPPGFAIGGVPPLGHDTPPVTLIEWDLLALDVIWAAAGTPNAVFRLKPEDLVVLTGGQVADLKQA